MVHQIDNLLFPHPLAPSPAQHARGNRFGSAPLARRRVRGAGGEGMLGVVNVINHYTWPLIPDL